MTAHRWAALCSSERALHLSQPQAYNAKGMQTESYGSQCSRGLIKPCSQKLLAGTSFIRGGGCQWGFEAPTHPRSRNPPSNPPSLMRI